MPNQSAVKKGKQVVIELLVRPFPQDLLIRKPIWGSLLFLVVLFVFIVAYRPLQVHETALLSFQLTVLAYCFLIAMAELLVASAIARTNGFSPKGNWTVSSEILAVLRSACATEKPIAQISLWAGLPPQLQGCFQPLRLYQSLLL